MAGHTAALPLIALPLSYLDSFQHQAIMSDPAGPDAPAQDAPGSNASLLTSAASAPASTPQAIQPLDNTAGSLCRQAAAATFEMVLSNKTSVLSLSNKMAHVVAKPLWQQRFYTTALQQLEKLLTRSDSTSPVQEASQGLSQQGPLLLALAYLLKGTPAKISKTDLPRLLKWLLMALALLQQPDQGADKSVIADLLKLVKTMIEDPSGRLCANVTQCQFSTFRTHHCMCWLAAWRNGPKVGEGSGVVFQECQLHGTAAHFFCKHKQLHCGKPTAAAVLQGVTS